jgi:dUTPase
MVIAQPETLTCDVETPLPAGNGFTTIPDGYEVQVARPRSGLALKQRLPA